MNTHVDFPTAKLLKDKNFDEKTHAFYREDEKIEFAQYYDSTPRNSAFDTEDNWFSGRENSKPVATAPTIAKVIMWLFEKHGIWVVILPELLNGTEIRYYPSVFEQGVGEDIESYFNSPTEAYEAAIKYILNELI